MTDAQPAMTALETAISEGCPETLFLGLCHWQAEPGSIVDVEPAHYRYSPNTRARALQYWRILRTLDSARVTVAGVEATGHE